MSPLCWQVVCDTAKVRFFKQITTKKTEISDTMCCLRYCKSTIFQANHNAELLGQQTLTVVCDTAKVRFFKQITTSSVAIISVTKLFAILQKYDFSSKSQPNAKNMLSVLRCLRYCKSTIFQANHNEYQKINAETRVVCDTAKVRFFKQITTFHCARLSTRELFAILQKYDFSSKSQHSLEVLSLSGSCLRYCKSTIFQANHNISSTNDFNVLVVCDTAKVRFFKQITTAWNNLWFERELFAILQKYDFSSKSQLIAIRIEWPHSCLRYCKSTIFQANHNKFPSYQGI